MKNQICALKIRRIDADRESMNNESHYHSIANAVGVGPQLKGNTKNIIAMEFVNGKSIIEWVKDTTKDKVRIITKSLLEQCRCLDKAGLDHGELSRLYKHVIISDTKPIIIDFESASRIRKTCNVTSLAQSVFLYGPIADNIKRILEIHESEKIINALKTYKQDQTDTNFAAILYSLLK
jgi:putative serine/threonine protein kinase